MHCFLIISTSYSPNSSQAPITSLYCFTFFYNFSTIYLFIETYQVQLVLLIRIWTWSHFLGLLAPICDHIPKEK